MLIDASDQVPSVYVVRDLPSDQTPTCLEREICVAVDRVKNSCRIFHVVGVPSDLLPNGYQPSAHQPMSRWLTLQQAALVNVRVREHTQKIGDLKLPIALQISFFSSFA